jgi:hypothetical protein
VVRGPDPEAIDQAVEALHALAEGLGATIKEADAG